MGIYSKYVLPRVVHFVCGLRPNERQREKVVPLATGRVLEIGVGSGLNLPFYAVENVEKVLGLDPSPEMWALADDAARSAGIEVEFVEAGAEAIPLDDESVDTVVMTYTLCTIPEPEAALGEIRRVLKLGGKLLFCEHGAAPDESVRKWQDRADPLWGRLAGGCHLNREITNLIEAGGFDLGSVESMYLPGWKPANFNVWGHAE